MVCVLTKYVRVYFFICTYSKISTVRFSVWRQILLNANKEYSENSKLIRQLQSNSPSLKNGEQSKNFFTLGLEQVKCSIRTMHQCG
jgi:hypothetical protein